MNGEISIMYPDIILYALIFSGVILLVWRKRKKFKKGVIVANTKYVKKTGYFKMLNAKYHLYNIIIKVVCILLILLYAVITARLYKNDKHEEEFNNRDIMLCMDFSPSVRTLNKSIIETMKETVQELKDERIGITIFDTAAITLVPLTSDYNYVLYNLDLMGEYFGTRNTMEYCAKRTGGTISDVHVYFDSNRKLKLYNECMNPKGAQAEYLRTIFTSGITSTSGGSLIGDGVATCANAFNDEEERTRAIILTTDNMVAGKQYINVTQAGEYAKKKGIKIFSVGTSSIANKDVYRNGLINLSNTTGGAYFDYKDYTAGKMSEEIEKLNKSAIVKTAYVTKKELPELLVPYLLYLTAILFVLDWRVRI